MAGYKQWGWIKGPLTQASVTCGVAEVQLLNSSSFDRTPHSNAKTLIITNPSTNAATKKVYIGKTAGGNTALSTSAFLAELKPGDPPFVVDQESESGFESYYALGAEAACPISVSQGG